MPYVAKGGFTSQSAVFGQWRRALFRREMMHIILVAMGGVLTPVALASQPACPKLAPAEWGIGAKPLESVRVMSYPHGVTPDSDREYYATPPMTEWIKAGYLYQSWYVNRDTDKFRYEVDCVYVGSVRYFGVEIHGMQRCLARWRIRRDQSVAPYSLIFHCRSRNTRRPVPNDISEADLVTKVQQSVY